MTEGGPVPDTEPETEPDAAPVAEQPSADGPVDRDTARALALVAEACRKSGMLWLRAGTAGADGRAYAAWHVWADGAAHLVTGGLEQDLPVLEAVPDGGTVVATVRSKDNGGRLVSWTGQVRRLAPGEDAYAAAVTELHAKRLNPPDGEAQPQRWLRESTVYRIDPTGVLVETPGRAPTGSHAAEPPGSPADTRGPLPFVFGKRARRRR